MFNKKINKKIDNINTKLDKSMILEIPYIVGSKKEIIKRNFLAGIARGIGSGIGWALVSALIIYLLRKLIALNLPVLGDYITDIVSIVQKKLWKVLTLEWRIYKI